MIMHEVTISITLDNLLKEKIPPIAKPILIKRKLKRNEKKEVRTIFNPAMLAPIPSPILFKLKSMPRDIASLKSIVLELFVSKSSGLSIKLKYLKVFCFDILLLFVFIIDVISIYKPNDINVNPPIIFEYLGDTRSEIKFPNNIARIVPRHDIDATIKFIKLFIFIFLIP